MGKIHLQCGKAGSVASSVTGQEVPPKMMALGEVLPPELLGRKLGFQCNRIGFDMLNGDNGESPASRVT